MIDVSEGAVMRKFQAMVQVKQGIWESWGIPVTLNEFDTFEEAMSEALDQCQRSPRDCWFPRVNQVER